MSLVVMEGLDGSGKGTQTELLYRYIIDKGIPVDKITFPDYESPSSSLVKMYLAGDFGRDADSVNAFAASAFYAVDRFASFSTKWGEDYRNGKLILADRYTTSNIVYQLSKLEEDKWDEFAAWIVDFEFNKIKLPAPDAVIYLDMPPEISQMLLLNRYKGDDCKKDIHESNIAFLNRCRKGAYYAANKFGWSIVSCAENGVPKTREAINKEIIDILNFRGII